MDFLWDPYNKKELFEFLPLKVAQFMVPQGKSIYITAGESVVSVNDLHPMPHCNHEEADTRMVAHIQHALQHGLQTVQVRTVDTDDIAILVGVFQDLATVQPSIDICLAFGMGKHHQFFSVNTMYKYLGKARTRSLPVFHALSGSDTTSAFNG